MKAKLERQLKKWAIIIDPPKRTDLETHEEELRQLINYTYLIKERLKGITYYLIIHDKDLNELGQPKISHIHLILKFNNKVSGAAAIELLTNTLNSTSEQISIEPIIDFRIMLRYLIHKDQSDKFQYSSEEVITNDQALKACQAIVPLN